MAITTRRAAFWKGCRESTPFFLVSCLFGLLFGVLAAEAGLGIIESMAFTVLLFAGSVQLTALQLMQEQAQRADRLSFSTGCKFARDNVFCRAQTARSGSQFLLWPLTAF